MKRHYFSLLWAILFNSALLPDLRAAATNLTTYNQDFAVVRENLALDLKAGVNDVKFSDAAVHLESDTVILRDPARKHPFQILEQNFRGDPISPGLLLNIYDGKELDFLVRLPEGNTKTVGGKVIRSGYIVAD